MRSYRHLALLTVAVATAFGATGCSKSSDTDSDAEPAAAQQEEQSADSAELAEAAEPALPKVDYWKPIVAAMQGEYRAGCAEGLERKPAADTIKIAADGLVSVGAVSFHPRDGKTTLMRTPPGKEAEGVSLINEDGEVGLTLNNFGPGADDHVTVNYSGKAVMCNGVKDVLRIDGRSLMTTFAQALTVKPRRITCTVLSNTSKEQQVEFALESKQLKVGEQVFDLDKIVTETVHLDDGTASYSVGTEPQRLALVSFDQYGRLSNVTVNGFDTGPSYACANLDRQSN